MPLQSPSLTCGFNTISFDVSFFDELQDFAESLQQDLLGYDKAILVVNVRYSNLPYKERSVHWVCWQIPVMWLAGFQKVASFQGVQMNGGFTV